MSLYSDEEFEQVDVDVLFATPKFFDERELILLSGGNISEYIRRSYVSIMRNLSAYCATKKGFKLNTLVAVGDVDSYWNGKTVGLRLIAGGNLANVLSDMGFKDYAVYIKDADVYVKGYINDEQYLLIIREFKNGSDINLVCNAVNGMVSSKRIQGIEPYTNSIGLLVQKALKQQQD